MEDDMGYSHAEAIGEVYDLITKLAERASMDIRQLKMDLADEIERRQAAEKSEEEFAAAVGKAVTDFRNRIHMSETPAETADVFIQAVTQAWDRRR